MIPYVSIDLETTGLYHDRHQILAIGAKKRSGEEFQRYVMWEEIYGSPFALKMNAAILQRDDAVPIRIALMDFGAFLGFEANPHLSRIEFQRGQPRKIVAAGKNFHGFDRPFLESARFPVRQVFHYRSLDPAAFFLEPDDVEPPSLQECLKRAGLEGKFVAHDVLDDARAVDALLEVAHVRGLFKA